ncbi:hypothetical protein BDV98DRAFT_610335 [Pterulicium gracile]|uniref:Uncharacterized protein n=1 Tax=Pterulicium gracile TaxID=1884261 RepID=A0A5C3QU90_9AGAR|nr:hypothetical protein BDV98DRAFT_610335 [Pterula gracilis]
MAEEWRALMVAACALSTCAEAFLLCAYLIRAFRDMPATAKLMAMKGHNGYWPCQACNIHGALHGNTYYTPLHWPGKGKKSFKPSDLPLRSHNKIIRQATEVEAATTSAEKKRLTKKYGINGLAVLSTLPSMSMTESFPLDLMHLIPLNGLKNLILMWTGNFKKTDAGSGTYQLSPTVLKALGEACAAASFTTPTVFDQDCTHFTAETWTLFANMLGPVYYDHFLKLVLIFNLCLCISISKAFVEEKLQPAIVKGVK